jgi:hypothetical protein
MPVYVCVVLWHQLTITAAAAAAGGDAGVLLFLSSSQRLQSTLVKRAAAGPGRSIRVSLPTQ